MKIFKRIYIILINGLNSNNLYSMRQSCIQKLLQIIFIPSIQLCVVRLSDDSFEDVAFHLKCQNVSMIQFSYVKNWKINFSILAKLFVVNY